MTLPDLTATVGWVGVTLYAVLAGADFGAGMWDLLAGTSRGGAPTRNLIEKTLGPVWEANHVWLIFVVVIFWTGFPRAFASVMSSLWVPLTLAALGIIVRGGAFAFRKPSSTLFAKRFFGASFAAASWATPCFLGMVAGATASERVPLGNALGDPLGSWIHPTSFLGGALAVATCGHLAAVYLTREARGRGHEDLAESFRTRGLVSGLVVGVLALGGIFVLRSDAPHLFLGLMGRALPLVFLASALGILTLVLLVWRVYRFAWVVAALSVATVIWGWGLAQYPAALPGSATLDEVAAHPAVLRALLWSLLFGALLLAPSLWLLFTLFRPQKERS